ncbi:MAG: hypothetical protein NZ602_14925 [Thermoguttaceae bacterium]|nr:hypothetical protein [Thermoguttaceae bacterium]MDW8038485.1 hypothetical protein [Thermoguttaceae bacterium]
MRQEGNLSLPNPLNSTFAILGLLPEGENSKSLSLFDLGNCVNKRSSRRKYWKQKQLWKLAKVELNGAQKISRTWIYWVKGNGKQNSIATSAKY